MDKQDAYKESIETILIKEKGYLIPDFSAQQLAERVGISAYALSRLLKATYSMSYTDIVHTYRIQDALRYLKDRRFAPYSIDDIGEMVGFKNRQSFFSAFKKATGTTPEKFRST
ncbi:MAG: helix-turn-helix transcriptional regulator [Bacteroidaceae bacterium]|nr:helix-turn-helix transcriptional regulator [Bacteroidaceae bacterium]